MSLREPEPAFVRQMKAYDRLLEVEWCEREPITGALVQRWRILRKGEDGRMRHIMFVQDRRTGGYQPLDNRVMEILHRADSHRYLSADDLIRAFDAEEELPERVAIQRVLERRYWDGIEEMADKMAFAMKDSGAVASDKELSIAMHRADAKQAVAAAYEKGKGQIRFDRKLGVPNVVKGTDS